MTVPTTIQWRLHACMIDVAVIGPKAAQGYVRMPAPVDVGDARPR